MLKKTGNKTEGYTITHVISNGAKKISRTLSTTVEGVSTNMEFSAATALSKNAIHAVYNDVEVLIVDDEEQGTCKLYGNILCFKDKLMRKSWYAGFEVGSSRPVILESNMGENYKVQQVSIHGGKYICTPNLVLWQEGSSFNSIPINIKRLRIVDDVLVIRGSYNSLYGTWLVDASDRLFYTTFAIDRIEKITRIGNTFAISDGENGYVLAIAKSGDSAVVDTTTIACDNNLHKRTYRVSDKIAFDAVTFSSHGINYVLINYAKLVQAGMTFKLADDFFTFKEDTLELIKISPDLAAESNNELLDKYGLETEEISVQIVKGEMPEESKLVLSDKTSCKGHVLTKNVFEPNEEVKSEESISATGILKSDVYKEISFTVQCGAAETIVKLNSNTKFCTKGNEITEKASGVRRFGNYLVLSDFLSSASVIVTLDKVGYVRGSNLKFVLPTDNFDLGVLGSLFSLEFGNCKIVGDYLKFTTKGIAIFDRTANKGTLVSYDGSSVTTLDVRGFTDLNYYALFDTEDWEKYYYVSLPVKEFVKINTMDVF